MRSDWGAFQGFMASGWVENLLRSQIVYTFRQFQMQRFITNRHPKEENHIGEAIVRENGEIEYLKTYRLSVAQTRRVYLRASVS